MDRLYEDLKKKGFEDDRLFADSLEEIEEELGFDSLDEGEKTTIIKQIYRLLNRFIPLGFVLGPMKHIDKEKAIKFLFSLIEHTCTLHNNHKLINDLIKYANIFNFHPLIIIFLHAVSNFCAAKKSKNDEDDEDNNDNLYKNNFSTKNKKFRTRSANKDYLNIFD